MLKGITKKGFPVVMVILLLSLFSEKVVYSYQTAESFRYPKDGGWTVVTGCDFASTNCWAAGEYHLGEDVSAFAGDPVYAPANGVIKHTMQRTGYGNVIIIEHFTGTEYVCSVMGHLRGDDIQVSVGQEVIKGQLLGYLGDSSQNGGYSPHYHFGINKGTYAGDYASDGCGGWVYGGYTPCSSVVNDWYDPTDFLNSHSTAVFYRQEPVGDLTYPTNSIQTFTLSYTNTSATNWKNSGGVTNPQYIELRSVDSTGTVEVDSGLYPGSGAAPLWINPQRVVSPNAANVAPGENAWFIFTAKMPSTPGDYYFYFRPYHASAGFIGEVRYFHINVINTAPSIPTNVGAAAGNSSVTVRWDTVAGADKYNIYIHTSPEVSKTNYTLKGTSTIWYYSRAGLSNGTTYYIVVTAENSYGESYESNEVFATPSSTMADTDMDGVSDAEESLLGTNLNSVDTDNDGLFDREEIKVYRTDPLNPDTDRDGSLDGDEVKNSCDPKQFSGCPLIDPGPYNYDFGTVNVGKTSAVQSFTVTNIAIINLEIYTIALTGIDATEFIIQNDNCTGRTLVTSESCTVDVIFSPTSAGAKSAGLSIPSDAILLWGGTGARLVSLSGTGSEVSGVIQLPQTGQKTCYDESGNVIDCAGTGQDGDIQAGVAWPEPRFTVDGDCIIDNLTGLMWAKNGNLPNGTRTWYQALDFVANLNSTGGLCGFTDWRLPNVNELESLVNADVSITAFWLNRQGFFNVQSNRYWSSTTRPIATPIAWSVNLGSGSISYFYKTSDFIYVWSVRSGQQISPDPTYPANIWKTGQATSYAVGDDGNLQRGVAWTIPRFSDYENGTVTDNLTGLTWTKDAHAPGPSVCNPATSKTWQEALDYVACLNTNSYLGYDDWRLPNRKELRSLLDYSKYELFLPTNHPFTNVQANNYWSSTTYNITSMAWFVDIRYGYVNVSGKAFSGYVWPVRSGQVGGVLIGDMNGDGIVDISDVILVLRCAFKRELDPCQLCSDINNDGIVDISDVILTLRMALGLDPLQTCT